MNKHPSKPVCLQTGFFSIQGLISPCKNGLLCWEHRICNESDLQAHIDYIHFNPVKHGYVATAKEWLYPIFHRYVQSGLLDENWDGVAVREGLESKLVVVKVNLGYGLCWLILLYFAQFMN